MAVSTPITLLYPGDHADSGQAIFDVSSYSTLRLWLIVSAAKVNKNRPEKLEVHLETGPEADNIGKSWRELSVPLEATEVSSQRIVLTGLDAFLRVRWTAQTKDVAEKHSFAWALAGDAL